MNHKSRYETAVAVVVVVSGQFISVDDPANVIMGKVYGLRTG